VTEGSLRVSRRLLAPEIVQTSAMDCGPASLKSLLEGHGISVSYGRLREACQTDVDGTSIDTIEEIARQLGLAAEQVMVPIDHLFIREAESFPGMLVVITPNGMTHFVVVWNQIGPFVQLMDPATGRRWTTATRLAREIYIHTMPVPASAFEEWARGDDFLNVYRRRLAAIGATSCNDLLERALGAEGSREIATLDAATRMISSIVETGAMKKGAEATQALRALVTRARESPEGAEQIVPEPYWTARPTDPDANGEPQVKLRGAVLVRIMGKRGAASADEEEEAPPLPPELAKALEEKPARPLRDLIATLREDGVLEPSVVVLGTMFAVACALGEALLLRGLLDVGRRLGIFEQRLAAGAMLVVFALLVLVLELVLEGSVLRIGRRLETRFRIAFQKKIPRLGDRYFQSRPASDMAERAHAAHAMRTLPDIGMQVVRSSLELIVTTGALVWIDPKSAPLAIVLGLVSIVTPLLSQGVLNERDLKQRTHAGALTRFHLDALLALTPLRAHGGERALMREHESLLAEWIRAGRSLVRASTFMQTIQAVLGCAATIFLVKTHVERSSEPASLLLFLYWALALPTVGEELGTLVRQYPTLRNRTLRLLEPLGAIDEGEEPIEPDARRSGDGVAIRIEGVSAVVGGRTILESLDVDIRPGEHVAIVGASGAGKSSLVGLLLGWHRPARGRILVDGVPLAGERLARLRRECAWVDPAVQIWNTSLYENLRYGNDRSASDEASTFDLVGPAGLRTLVEHMPEGLQTSLGESGALVSGGEGQRVRLGRALGRRDARLVIFDEPVRGLDRTARTELVATARARFAKATLLFVSHDIEDTLSFDRVLVIEDGRLVEDAAPKDLAADETSRFRVLLDADRRVRDRIWRGHGWRHLSVQSGNVIEQRREER
jgi:ABC-type bacteriocin/lantibiotic exporter with double-glycine peptidase domain